MLQYKGKQKLLNRPGIFSDSHLIPPECFGWKDPDFGER